MALLTVNAMSHSLKRTVTFNVYLPSDQIDFNGKRISNPPYKTLYLLHGILGDQNDWLVGSRIASLAKKYQIAVVMPAGENHFYLNNSTAGEHYSDFIGQELLEITRAMFPLSHKRVDTFIAGLSMGGYGALYNGMTFAKNFSAIGAFSAALVTEDASKSVEDSPIFFQKRSYYQGIFGDLERLLESDYHIPFLINKLSSQNVDFPRLFISCGTEDFLLPSNDHLADSLESHGVSHHFIKKPGGHTWDYWNQAIEEFLEWLDLSHLQEGVNSGNVGILKNKTG
ncbi:alpha/beta hydrolase [Streptococcus rifensis]